MAYPKFEDILARSIEEIGPLEGWKDEQLRELARIRVELDRLRISNPLKFYEEYESRLVTGRYPQREFHQSQCNTRLVVGGNRSGKSECGIIEDIWWASGLHPYRKIVPPTFGWIISLDFPTSRDVAEDKVMKWLPKYLIKKWDNQDRVITLTNGSQVGFRSCDQDINKFGGSAKHWIHFDEEPPGERGYQIYKECLMRTVDYNGSIWFTLTPVSGVSWSMEEIYERSWTDKSICVVKIDSRENPHVKLEVLTQRSDKMTQDEFNMRIKGEYVEFSGLVYKEFDRKKHIVPPFEIPDDAKRYRTIDHGLNAPTACLWLFVNRNNEYYVYDEYYETDKTISENCAAIKQITAGDKIEWTTIDPATDQRDAKDKISYRQEYRNSGVITRAPRSNKNLGIDTVKHLLLDSPSTKRPRLFIFENCVNLIKEMTRYRYRKYRGTDEGHKLDEVVKANDHCVTGDTLIDTTTGRYAIKDLVGTTGEVKCFDTDNKVATTSKFNDVRLTQKDVVVYKITTEDGREIKATAEHLVLTKNGWKQICSLNISDEIVDIQDHS